MQLKNDTQVKDDLAGVISVKFKAGSTLETLCKEKVENYNPDRFEALAIRFYFGKEMSITLYAIDKERLEGDNFDKEKMPVKKFKLNFSSLNEVLPFIEECNFTLTTGNYPLADMEVLNK